MRILQDFYFSFSGLIGMKRIHGIHIPIHMNASCQKQWDCRPHKGSAQAVYFHSRAELFPPIQAQADHSSNKRKKQSIYFISSSFHSNCGMGICEYMEKQ